MEPHAQEQTNTKDTPSPETQCRDPMHPAGQPHKTDLSAQPINSKRGTHTPHGAPTQAPGSPPWTIKLKEPRGSHSQSHHGRSNLNTIPRHCQSHSEGSRQHPRHKSSWAEVPNLRATTYQSEPPTPNAPGTGGTLQITKQSSDGRSLASNQPQPPRRIPHEQLTGRNPPPTCGGSNK
jgi:hypothetical protein